MESQTTHPVSSERHSREAALLAIARALNASLELEEALDEVLVLTARALPASAVSVFVPAVEGGQERLEVSFVHDGGPVQTAFVAAELGITAEVLESGTSVIVDDVRQDSRFQGKLDALAGTETMALIAVPLRRRDRVIGLMEAVRERPEAFSSEDRTFLEAVASEIAVAVDSTALLERLRRELLEREILLDVSREVGSYLELDRVVERVLDAISEVLPYDAAGVFLVDEKGGRLTAYAERGYPPDVAGLLDRASRKGVVRSAVERQRGIVVRDVSSEPDYIEARPSTRSQIAAPIVSGGRTIGAISLESDRLAAYGQHDLRLFELIAGQVSMAIVNARLHRRTVEQTQIDHELAMARDIQAGLFPDGPYPGDRLEARGINMASSAVGGDYYDYFPECDHHAGLAIADVSGHGLHAALLMVSVQTGVRLEMAGCSRPAEVAVSLNRLLHASTPMNQFVTAVLGMLDLASGELVFCNAGHPPQLHLRADGSDWLRAGGRPLGLFPDSSYESSSVRLEPGDLLVFFTDGLIEISDAEDHEFGMERLEATVRQVRDRPVAEIVEAVRRAVQAHRKGGVTDDITLMIARWCGPDGTVYPVD